MPLVHFAVVHWYSLTIIIVVYQLNPFIRICKYVLQNFIKFDNLWTLLSYVNPVMYIKNKDMNNGVISTEYHGCGR